MNEPLNAFTTLTASHALLKAIKDALSEALGGQIERIYIAYVTTDTDTPALDIGVCSHGNHWTLRDFGPYDDELSAELIVASMVPKIKASWELEESEIEAIKARYEAGKNKKKTIIWPEKKGY